MQPNWQKAADLVSFTEESFNGKLHFLCTGSGLTTSGGRVDQVMRNEEIKQNKYKLTT